LGDPLGGTTYTLCVYDNNALIASAAAPAAGTCGSKPCWSSETDGFSYRDPLRTPEGILKVRLRAGAAGDAQLQVKAKGVNLHMPDLAQIAGPVDVQLIQSASSVCWGARYSSPFAASSSESFKDTSD